MKYYPTLQRNEICLYVMQGEFVSVHKAIQASCRLGAGILPMLSVSIIAVEYSCVKDLDICLHLCGVFSVHV